MVRLTNYMDYEDILRYVEEGDLIECPAGLFSHWAVYVGKIGSYHYAVHRTGSFSTQEVGTGIIRSNLQNLFTNRKCRINNSRDAKVTPNPPNIIVDRAMFKINDKNYNLFFENCEHFANWCRYSQEHSEQVRDVALIALASSSASSAVASSSSCLII